MPNTRTPAVVPHAKPTKAPVNNRPEPTLDDSPRWRRRKDARPEEILAAAHAVFVERGFSATRADDVAARAGVSKGTLYLYFENKEVLFMALVRNSVVVQLDEGFEIVSSYQGDTMTLLDAILGLWWERGQEQNFGGLCKLVMAECNNFPNLSKFYYEEVVKKGHVLIEQIVQRGVSSGEFLPCDIAATADLLIAPYIMGMIWQNSLGKVSDVTHYDMKKLHSIQMQIARRGLLNLSNKAQPI